MMYERKKIVRVRIPGYDARDWAEDKFARNKAGLIEQYPDIQADYVDVSADGTETVTSVYDADKDAYDTALQAVRDIESGPRAQAYAATKEWRDKVRSTNGLPYSRIAYTTTPGNIMSEDDMRAYESDRDAANAALRDNWHYQRQSRLMVDALNNQRNKIDNYRKITAQANREGLKQYRSDNRLSSIAMPSSREIGDDYARERAEYSTYYRDIDALNAAKKLYSDAIETASAPSRYGDKGRGFANFWAGVKSVGANAIPIVDLAKTMGEASALIPAVKAVQEHERQSSLFDLVAYGKIDDVDYLSLSQKELLKAFVAKSMVDADRSGDLSLSYQAGQSAAQSLGFMLDFLLTGGLGASAGKAVAKPLVKQAAKGLLQSGARGVAREARKGASKLAINTVETAVKTAVMTPLMPSSYNSVIQNVLTINDEGDVDLSAGAVVNGVADALIETLSEHAGDGITAALGFPIKSLRGTALAKRLEQTDFARLAKAFGKQPAMQILKDAGYNGLFGEMMEEVYGNALRSVTGVDKDALADFLGKDSLLITLGAFAPTTLFGGVSSSVNYSIAKGNNRKAAEALRKILANNGYSDDKIDNVINVSAAETPAELGQSMQAALLQLREDNGVSSEVVKAAIDYMSSIARLKVLGGIAAQELDTERKDVSDAISAGMGVVDGSTPWVRVMHHTLPSGEIVRESSVRRLTDEEGNDYYVQSTAEDGSLAVIGQDGGKRIITAEQATGLSDTGEMTLNDFLDRELVRVKSQRERTRMEGELAQNRTALMEQAQPGAQINIGTAENPSVVTIVQHNAGAGTFVLQREDGSVYEATEEDVADYMSLPLTPKTDAEREADARVENDRVQALLDGARATEGRNIAKLGGIVRSVAVRHDDNGNEYVIAVQRDDGTFATESLTESEIQALIGENQAQPASQAKEAEQSDTSGGEFQTGTDNTDVVPDTDAPRDTHGQPLPMRTNKKGERVVDEDALWRDKPAEWCAYNDKAGSPIVTSEERLDSAVKTTQKKMDTLKKALRKAVLADESSDRRDDMQEELSALVSRLQELEVVRAKYNAEEKKDTAETSETGKQNDADASQDAVGVSSAETNESESVAGKGEKVGTSIQSDATSIESIDSAIRDAIEPMDSDAVKSVVEKMIDSAETRQDISYSEDEWKRQFPGNKAKTPIGVIKLGENQQAKLLAKKRNSQFGMMKPTLETPDVILYEDDLFPPAGAERTGKLLFIKTFKKGKEKKITHFENVTIRMDNLEIVISNHIVDADAVMRKLQSCPLVYIREALLSNSSEWRLAEQHEVVPDLVPTQENNALSTDEGSENSLNANTSSEETATASECFEKRLREQGKISAPVKTQSLEESANLYVSHDKTRPVLNGVYNDPSGYGVATDRHILVSSRQLYDEEHKGEIIAAHKFRSADGTTVKKGEKIEGAFPDWKSLFDAHKPNKSAVVYWNGIISFLYGVEARTKELSESDKANIRVLLRMPDGEVFTFNHRYLLLFAHAAKEVGANAIGYSATKRAIIANGKSGAVMLIHAVFNGDTNQDFFFAYDIEPVRGYMKTISSLTENQAKALAFVDGTTEEEARKKYEETREETQSAEEEDNANVESGETPQAEDVTLSDENGSGETTESGSGQSEPTLLDVVRTIYDKGKEVASKLFSRRFFDVAQTPKFMQELGLRGDRFTIRYGVIARHFGKDSAHTLPQEIWEKLSEALQSPFAVAKLTDKEDAYRIYTTLQTASGEFVVVGIDVKNAGRDIEVNSVSTVFGRKNNANLPNNEEVIYTSKTITPEQSSLLERPNFAQYPTEQELSADKVNENSTETSTSEALQSDAQEQTDESGNTTLYRKGESSSLEEVNRRFNEELSTLNEENADEKVFYLGMPSDILRSAGITDMPMKLYGNKILKKMRKHGFELSELKDLPEAIANPIAVFNNRGTDGNRSILTELRTADGNFLVTLTLGKGIDLDFNIVSSLFGKGDNKIIRWFNSGYATYINKEKALNYLYLSAPIAEAANNAELSSATKIVEDFENPTLSAEDISSRKGVDPAEEESKEGSVSTDAQGNPLNEDGTLKTEKVNSVSELTDEDFTNPTRSVELPDLPSNVDAAIGANGKPVVVKKNIFGNNRRSHSDLSPEQSRDILESALYNPDLYGQNQKTTRPYNWVVISVPNGKGENKLVLLELNPTKDNIEVVHWHYLGNSGLERIRKQAEREGEQLLVLPSSVEEEAGALPGRPSDLSSESKVSEISTETSASQEPGTSRFSPSVNPRSTNEDTLYRSDDTMYRIREKAAPKNTGIGYKVFVLKNGELYPPMVANPNGESTPVGVWLDADAAPIAGQSKTGRNQVKAGGKGTQGGSGKLAYRPGWHLGKIPYALQFNRKGKDGEKTLFPANFVWAEVEYANDVDYQEEAMSYGYNANGKFQHSYAGLPKVPENGAYTYRTNPNPETDPWIITGAMRVKRILTPTEVDEIVKTAGREPQRRQEGAITDADVNALNAELSIEIHRDGVGSHTDDEISYGNDPVSKVLGKSRFTQKQRKEFAERERQRMAEHIKRLADKLHLDNVEIVTDASQLEGKKQRAKGFYSKSSGKITIVIPNHTDMLDVEQTLLHEAVAHYGLRKLFGGSFNEILDDIFKHAGKAVRGRIADFAVRNGLDIRTATEEYLASLAETTEFGEADRSAWEKFRDAFRGMLRRLGFDIEFSESELRDLLRTSYDSLKAADENNSTARNAEEGNIRFRKDYSPEENANIHSGIEAVRKIAAGADFVSDAMQRDDLNDYEGETGVSFYWGETGNPQKNYKGGYGLSHIGAKHGTETLLNILDTIAHGKIERYVAGNKTIVLSNGEYECVLALTKNGEKSTWLLSGWRRKENADENGEVSTQPEPTQTNPTFSRTDLGAAFTEAKIQEFLDSRNNENTLRYRRVAKQNSTPAVSARDKGVRSKENTAKQLSKALGIPVKVIPASRIEVRNGSPVICSFKNGGIEICTELCRDASDVAVTALQEAVSEKGLRSVLGNDRARTFLSGVFRTLPDSVRGLIAGNAVNRYGANLAEATERFLAEDVLAESKGDPVAVLSDSETPEQARKDIWNAVKKCLREVLAENGIDARLSDEDMKWIMVQSAFADRFTNPLAEVTRQAVARHLGYSRQQLGDKAEAVEAVLFRSGQDFETDSAAELYDRAVSNVFGRLKESFSDMYQSVEAAVDAIVKTTGKAMKEFENVLLALNHQSSKALARMNDYLTRYFKPLQEAVIDLARTVGGSIEDVERYVMLKHGLERNRVFARRDALDYYRKEHDKHIDTIKKSTLSEDEKRQATEHEDELLEQHKDDIGNETDGKYLEFRRRDYSGLTGMYLSGTNEARRRGESELEYTKRVIMTRQPMFITKEGEIDLAAIESEALREVEEMEQRGGNKVTLLWDRINAATEATLKEQYKSNMLSREQYDRLTSMFKYYVPLRGFDDKTADDFYSYYAGGRNGGFVTPVRHAKGRTSKAASPFGFIAVTASSAITQNTKNETKLALYYFVSNRAENDLLSVADVWFEEREVDEDGKPIYEPVYPEIAEDATDEEVKGALDAFNKEMRRKAEAGLAFKGKRKPDVVVRTSARETGEHIIPFRLGGRDMMIVVHGNPRAAQAFTSVLNYNASENAVTKVCQTAMRWMASLNTQINPEFWVSNFQRDLLFSIMAVDIKESKSYKERYGKNLARSIANLRKYKKAYDAGTLGNSYEEELYRKFVDNGGVTGYMVMHDNEYWEKSLKELSKENRSVARNVINAVRGVSDFGEAIEQMTRFAAFRTSLEEGKDTRSAIADAKNLTVNFNRKGSGKEISIADAKKLHWGKDGRQLNDIEATIVSALSWMSRVGRGTIMFFNASVQALHTAIDLAKNNPAQMAKWAGLYLMLGMANYALHAMLSGGDGDDDDEYLDIPDHERRNNALLGNGEWFIKWALPQEMRVFYGLGDMIMEHGLGRSPDKEISEELFDSLAELLPLDMPAVATPWVDIARNKDYKGAKVHKEYRYYSDNVGKRIPKYRDPLQNTSEVSIELSRVLNALSGGNEYEAGKINLSPNDIEHVFSSYLGGAGTSLGKGVSFVENIFQGEFVVRDTPFLRRVLLVPNERYANAHTSDLYYHYVDEAATTARIAKEMKNDALKTGNTEEYFAFIDGKEYGMMQIVNSYKKKLKQYDERISDLDPEDRDGRKALYEERDALRKEMIDEISEYEKK